MKMIAIDQFVKNIILDCYLNLPSQAQVVVACVKDAEYQGDRDYTLNVAYVADKKQKGKYTGAVHVDKGDQLPDHAVSIRNMIAAHGIPSNISQGRMRVKSGSIDARIIELDIRPLLRNDFGVDQAGEILGVAPAVVANAYYRMNKRREPSGLCITSFSLVKIGKRLRLSYDQILNRLEAYYTR